MELTDSQDQLIDVPDSVSETHGEGTCVSRRAMQAAQLASSIKGLHDLYCSGALTAEEFQQAKQGLFADISGGVGVVCAAVSPLRGTECSESHRHYKSPHVKDIIKSYSSRSIRTRSHSATHSTSTSSSSSSSSTSSHRSHRSNLSNGFMVAPRAKVWLPLNSVGDSDTTVEFAKDDTTASVSMSNIQLDQCTEPLVQPVPGAAAVFPAGKRGRSESSSQESRRYGTFLTLWPNPPRATGKAKRPHVRLESSTDVLVKYFNSRGASGDSFEDVTLKANEMRSPLMMCNRGNERNLTRKVSPVVPEADMAKSGDSPDVLHSRTATLRTSNSANSNLEMCLNWYWIDVIGRDSSLKKYNAALRFLTQRFNLSESFLIDREHMLVLPQICISPEATSQFLICLRVATPQIALDDDNILELTNRWIIIVDLEQKLIITIHRIDCACMANMRHQWKSLMQSSDISFQEFLVKILDEAVHTFKASLDVHADLLDVCESKMFVSEPHEPKNDVYMNERYANGKILSHFSLSSRSPFLLELLDKKKRQQIDKAKMNMFLYHLHRRTNVQYRVLSLSQEILAQSHMKLRLCSKAHANQMCVHCIELSARALELRDEAKTLLNLHISLQSFRVNELMAVLTKFSVFFTPCSFLAGVYGMNFKHMPEYDWPYGYQFYWAICLLVIVFICLYMRRLGLLY